MSASGGTLEKFALVEDTQLRLQSSRKAGGQTLIPHVLDPTPGWVCGARARTGKPGRRSLRLLQVLRCVPHGHPAYGRMLRKSLRNEARMATLASRPALVTVGGCNAETVAREQQGSFRQGAWVHEWSLTYGSPNKTLGEACDSSHRLHSPHASGDLCGRVLGSLNGGTASAQVIYPVHSTYTPAREGRGRSPSAR